MTTRAAAKSKSKKPLETTLGKAPVNGGDDPIDISHVRKPIDTSIFGLRQVLELFETATDEVRRYVAYECDVMYECRMCRTIFRSLANFILHKRSYCRETYNPNDHTNCRNNCQENELYVNQEEVDSPLAATSKEQNSGTTSPIPLNCDSKQVAEPTNTNPSLPEAKENKKNLSYVLRRLQGRQQSSLITEQCLSEDVSNESKSSEKEEGKSNVALQKITDSTSGVFQTMFRNMIDEYKGDLMKTEVMEIHNILENNEAIVGSDGKIVASESEKSAHFMCTVCDQKFSTKKTLTYHIKYKHNNTRLVYQCPECNDTFANAWSVFRHLYKIHRKTTAQVKRLRNQIHANIIRRDQQPEPKNGNNVKVNSEPISNLQEKADLENQWMDDLEGDNDLQRCGGCGRKFERKAALHSHSQFCSKRIAVCNSIKENSAKRQTEEKQSDKTKISKTTSTANVENAPKGSRRRKQLISQKMCRIDYVKDNEIALEKKSEDCKEFKHDQEVKEEINKNVAENNKDFHSENEGDIIEVRDDSNDSENEEFVLMQNLDALEEEDKISDVDLKPVFIVQEPRSFSRSESRSSDSEDVIYIDTIKLSPSPRIEESANLVEPAKDLNEDLGEKLSSALTLNSIITRSKKNAFLNTNIKNSLQTIDAATIVDILEDNTTLQNSDIITQIHVDAAEHLKVTKDNDMNSETTSKNVPNINGDTIQNIEETDRAKGNKRKGDEPQAGNSKRKKEEVTSKDVPAGNRLSKTPKITLEKKSSKHVDKEKKICLPCEKAFKSYKSLMKHMAIHFSWYRYQCRSCSFMSYSRTKCARHVEVKHAIHDDETLKNTVMHIPYWKTIDKSTNFTQRCKKHKEEDVEVNEEKPSVNMTEENLTEFQQKDEEVEENIEKMQKDGNLASASNAQEVLETESSGKLESAKDAIPQSKPDVQDPSVRKMILEVIFGNQSKSSTQEEKDSEVIVEPPKEKDFLESLEQKPNIPEVDFAKKDDSTEDFLGFQNSTETEDHFKVENSALSSVVLRENPRPVRNRVPTVQKDFLYDMAQILKPKGVKDKEANATGSHKEIDPAKKDKQKPMKTYTKETKLKKSPQLTIANGKKPTVNKSVQRVLVEPRPDLVQDINMNSKDLKKHVTGDCD